MTEDQAQEPETAGSAGSSTALRPPLPHNKQLPVRSSLPCPEAQGFRQPLSSSPLRWRTAAKRSQGTGLKTRIPAIAAGPFPGNTSELATPGRGTAKHTSGSVSG